MVQSELFDRAADCEHHMRLADQPKRTAYKLLRDMWITLANESGGMSADNLAREIATIEKIQAAAKALSLSPPQRW